MEQGQISRCEFFFSRSALVGFVAKAKKGTTSSRARPFFISVKYFIKQAVAASLFAPGGRHANSGSVTRRPRFIMAVCPPPPVLRTSRRELCISRISHDPSSALCSWFRILNPPVINFPPRCRVPLGEINRCWIHPTVFARGGFARIINNNLNLSPKE